MINVKIRTKIFMFLGLSILIYTLLFSFLTFKRMENVIRNNYGDSLVQVFELINNNIDYNVNKFEISFNSFYAGNRFDSLIPTHIENYNDMLVYFRAVSNQISTYKRVNSDVLDLRIFSFDDAIPWDNSSIYSSGVIDNEPWIEPLLTDNFANSFLWSNEADDTGFRAGITDSVYCYTTVFDEQTNRPQAILRMDVDKKKLFAAIDTFALGRQGVVFVARENGDLIYSQGLTPEGLGNYRTKIDRVVQNNTQSNAFTAEIDGHSDFLVFSRNKKLGWLVIGSIPATEFQRGTIEIRNFILVISLLSIFVGFIGTYIFSALVSRRIRLLSNTIDRAARDNLEINVEISGNDEIGQVSHHFKEMLERIHSLVQELEKHYQQENSLINEKYELDILKKEAELHALQTQINPHFLYNTLEMMKGLLYSDDPKGKIIVAIQALSNTFKYNLAVDYLVRVRDEIQHVKDYLTIHNLRFDWQVELVNQLDDVAMNTRIVRFTLEPLIENAIIHGLRNMQQDCQIIISSVAKVDELTLSIHNDGCIIPAEKLSDLKPLLAKGDHSFSVERKGGLGIHNVNGRIKQFFGPQYGIDLDSTEGIGTTVRIRLPLANSDSIYTSEVY